MRISIIIPTFNEEKYINRCIKSLLKRLKNNIYEIIIIDSSFNNEILKRVEYFPVKVIKIISRKKGKGYQMNIGVNMAKGDILIFLHADTILPDNTLTLIKENIEDNLILSFSLGFYDKKKFFRMIEFFGKIRCFFTKIPYGDQCYIMKKNTFFKIGKFPEESLEDVKFIKKAKKKNIKIKILREKVKTSSRKWYKYGFIKTTLYHRLTILKYMLFKK